MSHYVISGRLLLVSLVSDSALSDMEIATFVIAGSTVGKSGMLSLLLSCTTVSVVRQSSTRHGNTHLWH